MPSCQRILDQIASDTSEHVEITGRRSKTVAFFAILVLTTFGALATASAQPADIKAIDKAWQDHYNLKRLTAAPSLAPDGCAFARS